MIGRLKDSPHWRVMVAALLSAVTWFAWAYWANRGDSAQALLSGLSQGGVSFVTTSIGSTLLEIFFNRMGHRFVGALASVAMVSSLSLGFMVFTHTLAGTPNLFLTIAPVFTVVLLYCSSYVFGLHKIKLKHDPKAVETVAL